MQNPESDIVHTIDLEPAGFHIGTRVVQDLLATPRNRAGDHIAGAFVRWQVLPEVGVVEAEDGTSQCARFIAGRFAGYARLSATSGQVSVEMRVVVSAASGMRCGFRAFDKPFPLILPPDPVTVRRGRCAE